MQHAEQNVELARLLPLGAVQAFVARDPFGHVGDADDPARDRAVFDDASEPERDVTPDGAPTFVAHADRDVDERIDVRERRLVSRRIEEQREIVARAFEDARRNETVEHVEEILTAERLEPEHAFERAAVACVDDEVLVDETEIRFDRGDGDAALPMHGGELAADVFEFVAALLELVVETRELADLFVEFARALLERVDPLEGVGQPDTARRAAHRTLRQRTQRMGVRDEAPCVVSRGAEAQQSGDPHQQVGRGRRGSRRGQREGVRQGPSAAQGRGREPGPAGRCERASHRDDDPEGTRGQARIAR